MNQEYINEFDGSPLVSKRTTELIDIFAYLIAMIKSITFILEGRGITKMDIEKMISN